jgi:cytochrome c-type biogenesis protein CcmH
MTVFVAVSTLLVAGALLFIVPPLLRRHRDPGVSLEGTNLAVYRDQLRELEVDLRAGTLAADQYDKARRELEKRMLEDVGTGEPAASRPRRAPAAAIAAGIAIPLCALAIYLIAGNPRALAPESAGAGDSAHAANGLQLQALVVRLAARLKNNPEDAEGWILLGHSYGALGRFADAAAAYSKAAVRMPQDAQLLADYADALAMAQGGRLQGEPEKIIARALKADPRNLKALALAGTIAFDKKDYSGAVDHWERILDLAPQDSEFVQSVRTSVAEARALLGERAPPRKQARLPDAGTGAGRISGVARLSPALAGKVGPADTVFIFARAAEGPRMPLAVTRKQVRDLPVAFRLDDSMAMAPTAKLSDHARVVVGARISKSGNPTPQPGDLEGLSAPVKPGDAGVVIVIDRELRDKK